MSLTRLRSPAAAARWLQEWVTGTLRTDSRVVKPGDAFIAWPGYAQDGRRHVAAALAAGASTCLVEDEGVEPFGFEDARIASLPRLKAATGPIADEFFGRPTQALDLLATTGTNGKTSTAWWIAQALTALGRRCGVVGTLGIGVPPTAGSDGEIASTGLTTPDPVTLQAGLRRFVDQGFAACAIEASSIGLVEHRLSGSRIAGAMFTNFTRDHLDYHGSMDAYWAAKRMLFDWPGLPCASVNIDDPQGAALAFELRARDGLDLWTCSRRDAGARLHARDLRYTDGGLAFTLCEGEARAEVATALIGDYNVDNLLGVIGLLRARGVALADVAAVARHLTPVPGRLQRVEGGASLPEVVVDYAHTPDALEKALAALRPLAQARGGRLWCLFGCGGNRDATKRPLMGAIAERLADRVVVTSDNPRHEAPGEILRQIVAGLADPAAARVQEDRREAIADAVREAAREDVLLIAGKGHEDYQEIAGVRHPFSDLGEAQRALYRRLVA